MVTNERESEPGTACDASIVGGATAKESLEDGFVFFSGPPDPRRPR